MNVVTLAVAGYVLVSLAIGWWISRRVSTEDDYLVGGRSLGYALATFTIFATWFGAETCVGAAGSIYANGLAGGSADPFGYGLCLLLMGLVFAKRLWRLRLTTVADVFRRRYSPGVERLAVLLMAPTSVIWAAAQIRAFGQVLTVSSGLKVEVTITLAAAVVILYTMMGGLLADAWTDLVQGIALIIGLGVLWLAVMRHGGAAALLATDPERLRLLGPPGTSPWALLEAWAVPLCGSVLATELVARVIACRSAAVARRSSLVAAGGYLLVGLMPVTLGLAGWRMMGGLEHPEQLLPRLAQSHLPPLLFAVFAGALVSAILSTVDSALLAASSLVSHNLVLTLAPALDERRKVTVARTGVVVFGIMAYVLALNAEGVYALVEEASAFGSAGVFVVLLMGLYTNLGGATSAYASLVAGAAVWFAGAHLGGLPYPYVTALAAALGVYLLAALLPPGTIGRLEVDGVAGVRPPPS